MRVLISGMVLGRGRSGYYRVIRNLISSIGGEGAGRDDEFVFVLQSSALRELELDLEYLHPSLRIIVVRSVPNVWIRGLYEQIVIPILALIHRVDCILMPSTFGLMFPVKPVTTFVHTNTSFKVEKRLRGRSRLQQLVHYCLSYITSVTSRVLIFTSRTTHGEYCDFLGRDFDLNIVGNGLLIESSVEPMDPLSPVPERFVLTVSQFYRLKNFDGLIRGLIAYRTEFSDPGMELVIVGTVREREYYSEICKLAEKAGGVHILSDISEGELAFLLARCTVFANVSLFEGFSLTPAEALLAGRQAVVSEIPVHREVYGRFCTFCDPLDPRSIGVSIQEAIMREATASPSELMEAFSQGSFNARLTRYLRSTVREA